MGEHVAGTDPQGQSSDTGDAEDTVTIHNTGQGSEDGIAYWNAERMAAAIPREVALPKPAPDGAAGDTDEEESDVEPRPDLTG